jgi:hypothetical protein
VVPTADLSNTPAPSGNGGDTSNSVDSFSGNASAPVALDVPPPPSQVAPGAYDLSRVTADQIAQLKKGSHDEQQLGATLERCQQAYGSLVQSGARVVVSTPAGNGGKPVVTLVPAGFDPSQPARVHTHYHGFNSSVAEPPGHAAGVTHSITASMARDPQTIFVLPECGNVPVTSTHGAAAKSAATPAFHTDWSNVSNEASTTDDALAAAGYPNLNLSERVVSAHSGGGRALGYAMQHTPDGSGLEADRIELEDCMYSAPKGALSARDGLKQWAQTPNGQQLGVLVYYSGTGGNDAKPDAALKQLFAGRYVEHGGFEHNASCAKTLDQPVQAPSASAT